jgi:hypothetical protein
MILKDFFKDFFKNILGIFPQKQSQSNKKVGECGPCYPICTQMWGFKLLYVF